MKIGIIADTHENMPKISRAVELFNSSGVDAVFHAGDLISPITLKELKNLKSKMHLVFGNNDGEKKVLREKLKETGTVSERYFETTLEDRKILMMHEPELLAQLADSGKYDVIIYGHTHIAEIKTQGKTLIINPGEACGWLHGKSTAAVLDLQTLKCEIIEI
ncbi:MAG: hypothetical protein A2252_07570 [Elusimicrobia bacterium RIFOXYA2_FULL_39_19]|nr:MAG: hypothetical protein A2252_07570 [Elusimicrobia bacterium RIFOXYA2_FULL_39_19]